MATKLTITIPDELDRQLDPWRDRMNISRVCAAAIEREIETVSAGLSPEAENYAKTILRLRTQSAEFYAREHNSGRRDGMAYARAEATFEEFLKCAEIAATLKALRDHPTLGQHKFTLPDEGELNLAQLKQVGDVTDEDSYREGWIEGMMVVWDAIKDKV
jgi:hypothetical protein